jgi:hypothetical protein
MRALKAAQKAIWRSLWDLWSNKESIDGADD